MSTKRGIIKDKASVHAQTIVKTNSNGFKKAVQKNIKAGQGQRIQVRSMIRQDGEIYARTKQGQLKRVKIPKVSWDPVTGRIEKVANKFTEADAMKKSQKQAKALDYRTQQHDHLDKFKSHVNDGTKDSGHSGLKSIGLEAKASYFESIAKHKAPRKSTVARDIDSAVSGVKSAAKREADDGSTGGALTSASISAAGGAYTTFRVAQKMTPTAIEAVKNAPQNLKKIGSTSVKVVKGIGHGTVTAGKSTVKAVRYVVKSRIYVPSVAAAKIANATKNAAKKVAKETVTVAKNTAQTVQRTARNVKQGVQKGVNAVKKTYTTIKGLGKSDVKRISKQALMKIKYDGLPAAMRGFKKGANAAGRMATKGVTKGTVHIRRVTVPTVKKIGKGTVRGVSSALSSSDDMMMKGMGTAIRTGVTATKVTTKVATTTAKTAAKVGVKTTEKTVAGILKTARYAKAYGAKKTAKKAASKAFKSAGHSVVTAAMNLVKAIGSKALVPILLIVGGGAVIFSIVSSLVGVTGSLFGGVFNIKEEKASTSGAPAETEYEEQDVTEYVQKLVEGYTETDKSGNTVTVKGLREQYLQDECAALESRRNEVNFINFGRIDAMVSMATSTRRYANGTNDYDTTQLNVANLSAGFYTAEEISDVIEPLFNALVVSEYDAEPKKDESEKAVKDIFDSLFSLRESKQTDYCGGANPTCGKIHAEDSCMDYTITYHTNADGYHSCCDVYQCQGHEEVVATKQVCDGHDGDENFEVKMCSGHQVIVGYMNVGVGGVYPPIYETQYHHANSSGTSTAAPDWMRNFNTGWGYCDEYAYYYDSHTEDEINNGLCGNSHEEKTMGTIYHGDAVNHYFTLDEQRLNGCSNGKIVCSGHKTCNGHKTLTVTVSMDGFYALVTKYFTTPIGELSAKQANGTISEAEKDKLSALMDNYDLFIEMVENSDISFKTLSKADLRDVSFTKKESGRMGLQSVSSAAINAIGEIGGEKYWKTACGYSEHTPWNALFVYSLEKSVAAYTNAVSKDDYKLPTVIDKLKRSSNWKDQSYADVAVGDVVVMTDKIGIYIGCDENYVYVVEGDNGDAVRCMAYEKNSSYIQGYFLTS